MTRYLPPNLLALFQPREPVPFLSPLESAHVGRGDKNRSVVKDQQGKGARHTQLTGVAQLLDKFTPEPPPSARPPKAPVLTKEAKRQQRRLARFEAQRQWLAEQIPLWKPLENPQATADAYKTLFVARLNYALDEAAIRREFEVYGPIKSLRLVRDSNGKSRGYAFIEYEREKDLKAAYKEGESKRLGPKNMRVLVDVERGRTVKDWRPRRLGGGLGHVRDDKGKRGVPLPPSLSSALVVASSSSSSSSSSTVSSSSSSSSSRTESRRDDDRDRDRHRDDRERDRDRHRDDKERERDRERRDDRDRDRERDRERDRHRDDKDRDRHRDDRDRDRERRDDKDRDRHRDDRDRRDRDDKDRRDRDRDDKDRRDRDRERDHKRSRDDEQRDRDEPPSKRPRAEAEPGASEPKPAQQ